MSIFDKWNSSIDVDGLRHDVEEAAANGGGDYKDVPHDSYEVAINKMELKESKNGNPMLSIWFKVLTGDFKGSMIFMNQVLTSGFGIHKANEFLKSLGTDVQVEFKDYSQYNDCVLDVFEAVNGKMEYVLNYGENNKGYNTFEIEDVFELE